MPRKKLPSGIYKREEVYYCCFTANGTRVRKKLSTDLEVSKVMLRKLRLRHEAGEVDNDYPFAELVERYFRAKPDLAPSSAVRYRQAIKSVTSTMRVRFVSDVTPELVYRHREKQAAKGLAGSGTEQEISVVRSLLRWGVRQRIVATNPIGSVDKLKVDACEVLPFSLPEAEAILENSLAWCDIFRVAFASGLRRGELSGLNAEDVDLDSRVISVPRRLAKTKTSIRTVPILDCVYGALEDACQGKSPGDAVFPGNRGSRIYKALSDCLASAAKRASVPMQHHDAAGRLVSKYSFHSTRHSFATWLRQNGALREHVEDLLGHKRASVTDRYLTFSVSDLRGAISKHPWGSASHPQGIVPFSPHLSHKHFRNAVSQGVVTA